MNYSWWLIAGATLGVSLGFTGSENWAGLTTANLSEFPHIATVEPYSTESNGDLKTELERREFSDRLSELQDWESDLDRQEIGLKQEHSDLQCQITQNQLELERVEVDRRDIQRSLRELAQDKDRFEKQAERRQKWWKLRSSK